MNIYSFIIAVLLCPAIFAQNCPSLTDGTKAVAGELGYKSRGAYCEGLVTNTNSSGKTLELASFSLGPIDFANVSNEELTIKTIGKGEEELTITGKSFNLSVKYRLDFRLKLGETRVVKTDHVIRRSQITKDNLGVWGYKMISGQELYYPLSVSSKSIRVTALNANYHIVLVKNAMTRSVSYRYAPYKDGVPGKFSESTSIGANRIVGDKVSFDLPRSLPKGIYLLRINYTLGNSEPMTKDFLIKIP